MKNEKGGTLLELVIATTILLAFTAGILEIHIAWIKRYKKIVDHRNEVINKIRTTKPVPNPELLRLIGVGSSSISP